MIKQEVAEIKKLFTMNNCSITRICGCYVDGEKNKKTEFKEAFLALPEEEMFKYFEIFRKTLSGRIGKHLLNLDIPLVEEYQGGAQELLLRLRDSKLKDNDLLESYYDRIIRSYEYVGNYLILVIHDVYDVPGKTSDGVENDDASEEIYEYLLTCICPVNLSKPGLNYNVEENTFQNRIRDWVVGMPEVGILFPAFNDRGADIHSALYYSKDSEELKDTFVEQMLGCEVPLSAGVQDESFQIIIEELLGDECDVDTVKAIHDNLTEMAIAHKEDSEPLLLDKNEIKTLFAKSGVSNEKMDEFDSCFDCTIGEKTVLLIDNITHAKTFDVKTPDVIVKVKADRTDLVEEKVIDGRRRLVITLEGDVEVNGVSAMHCGEI